MTTVGGVARIWDAEGGIEIARWDNANAAVIREDEAVLLVAGQDNTARIFDISWPMLTGDKLTRAVARKLVVGEGRLTDDEMRTLHPLLGSVDPDVTSRWFGPSRDDAAIETAFTKWCRHREMAFALARKDWSARAEEINAALEKSRQEHLSAVANVTTGHAPETRATSMAALLDTVAGKERRSRLSSRARIAFVLLLLVVSLGGLAATEQIDISAVVQQIFARSHNSLAGSIFELPG